MQQRIDYRGVAPGGIRAMTELEHYIRESGLEESLLHLIQLRASQVNGCAYCVDMHSREAREDGESEQRLYAVVAWRDAPFFSERERAALAWTEALTLVSERGAPDDLYEAVREHFTEKELVDLTLAIATINAWNRTSIAFRPRIADRQMVGAVVQARWV
jgi:AhpD family alkylhydroperoxidase